MSVMLKHGLRVSIRQTGARRMPVMLKHNLRGFHRDSADEPWQGRQASVTRSRLLRLCFALVVLLAALGPGTPHAADVSLEEPDYRGLVLRCVDVWLAGDHTEPAPLVKRGYIRRVSEMAAGLAHAWRWTGNPLYAAQSRRRLEAILDAWELARQPGKPWKQVCFFSVYPILDAYAILEAGGQLDAALQDRFRRFLPEGYFPLERGAFNQSFARAAGLALAAQRFPGLPPAGLWREYSGQVWNDWYPFRDTTENATVYNAISMFYLFLLADASGKAEAMRDPGVERMLRRFRDQQAPSGAMPEYGDSGDGPWGVFHAWGNWVAAFERAAREYRDPTFRYAALRMFHAATRYRALDQRAHAIDSANMVHALAFADAWRDRDLRPAMPSAGTAIALRNEPGRSGVPDKLILAGSREPGTPYAMAELYSRWHHAHDNQWGSLLHYEVGDRLLLGGLGYHNRCPEHANLVLVCPADEPFPHRTKLVPPGVWQEASLAAHRIAPATSEENQRDLRQFDRVILRVAEQQPVELLIDNLRLSGPAGEKMLDDFEQLRGWRGGQPQLSDDATQGRRALKLTCKPGVTFAWRGGFHCDFSLRDYDRIRFSWKMLGAQGGWSNSLVFRLDTSLSDYHVPSRQLSAVLQDARVESRAGDHFGVMRLEKWFTDDSRLTRRLVLLREGPLVICDDLSPGAEADGQWSGPIWHLRTSPDRGKHWFDLPGPGGMLAWFAPGAGREFGLQSVELWGRIKPFTIFTRQKLRAGRAERFLTVFVPHGAEARGDRLAAGISLREDRQGASILRLPVSGHPVEITFTPDGNWQAARP